MPFGPEYAKDLAKKAPKPDAMAALMVEPDEDDEAEMPDEDGDQAAAMSAYEDFARLAGFKASPQTFAALKEVVRLITKG